VPGRDGISRSFPAHLVPDSSARTQFYELEFLPPLELEDNEKELDVVQDDHLLNF